MLVHYRRLSRLSAPIVLAALLAASAGAQVPALAQRYDFLHALDGSPLPQGDLGRSIARGYAILQATRDSLPRNVGNNLRCASCHLDDGRRLNAMPYLGVFARFPQFRSRSASVQRLEDRINDCFQRSLNGKALAWNDPAMRDIVAYMAFLSKGAPVGGTVEGQGVPLATAVRGDTTAGKAVYADGCARCHGARGEGKGFYPPLWGPRSFSIGAGMARMRTGAGFIRANMPYDRPGTLSETDAANVAAYVLSRPRPDFVGKENDWPRGDPPPDAAYPTKAGRKPA